MLYVTVHSSHQWLINLSQHKCIYIETALNSRTKLSCTLRKIRVNVRKKMHTSQFIYLLFYCWYEWIFSNKIWIVYISKMSWICKCSFSFLYASLPCDYWFKFIAIPLLREKLSSLHKHFYKLIKILRLYFHVIEIDSKQNVADFKLNAIIHIFFSQ